MAISTSNNSGHLISRITYNVTMVTGAATDAIKVVIREGMTVVFLFGYLLWMNWKLTLVMVAILPIIGVMVSSASRKFRKQSRKIQAAMGDLTHVASETIQGYRVVRSFGGEDYESTPLPGSQRGQHAKQLRMVKNGATFTPGAAAGHLFSTMAVLLFWSCALRGDASAGDLVAYITAAGMLPKPIRQLSEVSGRFRKGWPAPRASFPSSTKARTRSRHIERSGSAGGSRSSNLSFVYPGSACVLDQGQLRGRTGPDGRPRRPLGQRQVDTGQLIPRFYHHDSARS
jgi:subfamily B ATP-binding cassette protein MsbA